MSPDFSTSLAALSAPLRGSGVRLTPLSRDHTDRLHLAFRDDDLWTWQGRQPANLKETAEWVEQALVMAAAGAEVPFVIESSDGRLAGTTRYLDLRWNDSGLEIGWTMVFAPFRRTHVNTETKLLLLRRAFDELGMARVQLKTDALNVRSRAAIERIGARFEGILRCHKRRANGTLRDSAFFSIISPEWAAIKGRLQEASGPAV